ncbi:hypothetical protein ACGLWX_05850 [Halomonas sp. HMF6819]|uniref:hypothetical protein n=1 Tax=Halomonas sp. HMF6819 TaxID=3373085 RepID=UPI003787EC0A
MSIFVPNELVLQPINAGDQIAFITKFNNTQAVFALFAEQCNQMVQSIDTALSETLKEAEQTRQQAITDTNSIKDEAQTAAQTATNKAGEAASSADDAAQSAAEAQQIAVGDVAITSLQPGTLITPKDYVSVDEQGALAKRNLATDVSEQLASGSELVNASSYTIKGGDPGTTTLDLATQQVFELDNPTSLTITFENIPAAGLAKPVLVDIDGAGSVEFVIPGYTIRWEGGEPPAVFDNWSTYRIMFTGSRVSIGSFGG